MNHDNKDLMPHIVTLSGFSAAPHGKFRKKKRKERINEKAILDSSLMIIDFDFVSQSLAKTVILVIIPK